MNDNLKDREDRKNRMVAERTARLRVLRVAADASRELDRAFVAKAAAPIRPLRCSGRKPAQSIPIEDLNAANDK